MSHGVKILNTTQIPLPPRPHPLPPPVKLSFLDSFWIMIPPVQKLLLFSSPITQDLTFPSLLESLKSSLTCTLLDYLSLAGKLTYVATTGDIVIDLSDPSVTFVEAESELNFQQLAGSEIHDVKSFMRLVPMVDAAVMPFPVLAVQVTRFGCGGLAIGYSVHHAVADGKAMHEFMAAWATTCKAKLQGGVKDEILQKSSERRRDKPSYDRSVIQHPRGDDIAKTYFNILSPNLPKTGIPTPTTVEEGRLLFRRRTFVLDPPSIHSLKTRATQSADENTTSRPPSTFIAVSAYIWASYVQIRSLDPSLDTIFAVLMDCRSRLNPPLKDDYFGNCIRPVLVSMLISELIGEDGLARACTRIRECIVDASKDPLRDCESWFANVRNYHFERVFNVTASPKFRVYDTDFGWGRPVRFEPVSLNRDGEFSLAGGKEEGSVQVTVVVKPEELQDFEKYFLGGLVRNIYLVPHWENKDMRV